jgi:DNA-binding XRE family transcriptional regulator
MAKYDDWITDEGLIKIEGWARDGLTEEQIAHNMGVSTKTLFNWKEKFLPVLQALKRGKEVVDRQVENALLKRALGYKYDETTYEQATNTETGEKVLTVSKVVTKEVQPDTTAQIFWLKNRKPAEWRDKTNVEHSGSIENTIVELSPEERRARIDELIRKRGNGAAETS